MAKGPFVDLLDEGPNPKGFVAEVPNNTMVNAGRDNEIAESNWQNVWWQQPPMPAEGFVHVRPHMRRKG